ncbi:MAG: hypothetical protein R2939_08370 [Kofleriaceae bacterium]
MARKRLGEMLIEAGVIDEPSLRAALAEQKRWGGTLGRALVELRLIDENTLVATLSAQLNFPSVDLDAIQIPDAVVALVPGDLCEHHSIVPFAQPFKFLDVGMSDPTNLGIIDELRIRTQLNVRPYLAGPKMIERALRRYYSRGLAWGARGHSGSMTIDDSGASGRMELVDSHRHGGSRTTRPPPTDSSVMELSRPRAPRDRDRDAEIAALQERLSRLEALVARDEDVIKKLMALLVDKGLATRDEILARIR